MKPVGKPDAGNPHVRFDERGRETERLPKAQATAPFLDSTPDIRKGASGERQWRLALSLSSVSFLYTSAMHEATR
jgi:hypothetical protein